MQKNVNCIHEKKNHHLSQHDETSNNTHTHTAGVLFYQSRPPTFASLSLSQQRCATVGSGQKVRVVNHQVGRACGPVPLTVSSILIRPGQLHEGCMDKLGSDLLSSTFQLLLTHLRQNFPINTLPLPSCLLCQWISLDLSIKSNQRTNFKPTPQLHRMLEKADRRRKSNTSATVCEGCCTPAILPREYCWSARKCRSYFPRHKT